MKVKRWIIWGCVVVGVVVGLVIVVCIRITRGYYEMTVDVERKVYEQVWRDGYARVLECARRNRFEASLDSMKRYDEANRNNAVDSISFEFMDMARRFGGWLVVHPWAKDQSTMRLSISAYIGDNRLQQVLGALLGQEGKMPKEICEEMADVIAEAFRNKE